MIVPDRILEKMDPADRAKLPRNIRRTKRERWAEGQLKLESDMHGEFGDWLILRKHLFSFVHANPTKPSTIRKGWPDFTVIYKGRSCLFIEFKISGNVLSESQVECFHELSVAGAQIYVCTTFADAMAQVLEFFQINQEQLDEEIKSK